MNMHVRDAFSAVRTIVDDQSIARFCDAKFSGQSCGSQQQMSEQGLICGGGKIHARDELFRNHQYVYRRLRIDIMNRDTQLVFVSQLGRNLPVDNFLKESLGHNEITTEYTEYAESEELLFSVYSVCSVVYKNSRCKFALRRERAAARSRMSARLSS